MNLISVYLLPSILLWTDKDLCSLLSRVFTFVACVGCVCLPLVYHPSNPILAVPNVTVNHYSSESFGMTNLSVKGNYSSLARH